MIFGPTPLAEALGTMLAHSTRTQSGTIRKGTILDTAHLDALRAADLTEVVVARLEPGDLWEDEVARRIGDALAAPRLTVTAPSTGRVNVLAEVPGLISIDSHRVTAFNGVDEGLTLATLTHLMRVEAGQMVATVKVIPYGLPGARVAEGEAALGKCVLTHLPFRGGAARILLTRTPDMKESLIEKGADAVTARARSLGYTPADPVVVAHTPEAVARALGDHADITLILTASATSDRADVAPSAVLQAGGTVTHFGMPVDPGNLLFLATRGGAPVVGLPGCARSPALNGADWVLERLAAGLNVTGEDIAAMGVGGLLKEMPDRPHPRGKRG